MNDNTQEVLQECYKVFLDSQQLSKEYLAVDFLFDIQKHFGIKLKTLDNPTVSDYN